MDLVFVFLETEQPPAADSHAEESGYSSEYDSSYPCSTASTCQSDEDAATCDYDQYDGQSKMSAPRYATQLAPEDWE